MLGLAFRKVGFYVDDYRRTIHPWPQWLPNPLGAPTRGERWHDSRSFQKESDIFLRVRKPGLVRTLEKVAEEADILSIPFELAPVLSPASFQGWLA